MKQIAPFLVMMAILITIAVCIVVISNYNLKKKIIDRGPIDDNSLQFLNKLSGLLGQEMLKWGLIVLFGGIGLVVLEFIPFDAENSPLPYGVEAIFIALAFLTYYFLVTTRKL
jgi:hypothetical protein